MKFSLAMPLALILAARAGAANLKVEGLSLEGAGSVSPAGTALISAPDMPLALSVVPSFAALPVPVVFSPVAAAPAAALAATSNAAALPALAAAPSVNEGPKAVSDAPPSAVSQLHAAAAAWAKSDPNGDARDALDLARTALYQISGGSADGNDVSQAKLSLAQRTDYFRSPVFHNWVAAEKAAGHQVFWLKDIDKTQAAGDTFTYFFQWRALNGKITPAQNETIRAFLKTVFRQRPRPESRARRRRDERREDQRPARDQALAQP